MLFFKLLFGIPSLVDILVFGFTLVALAISGLYLLSSIVSWPKRRRKDFLVPVHSYEGKGEEGKEFLNLLRNDPYERPLFTSSTVYLTVIVPTVNEEERLPIMLDECFEYLLEREKKEEDFSFEIIVVEDGSTDRTADIAAGYGLKHAGKLKVLKLERNLGKGGAVRSGVMHSGEKVILFADADGATKFSDIEKLEKALIGMSPGLDETFPGVAVGSREICTKVFSFREKSHLKVFPVLHIECWAFDVELIYLCELWRIPIAEVSVTWHEVEGSKIVPVLSWVQMGRDLLLIWFRYRFKIWTDTVQD